MHRSVQRHAPVASYTLRQVAGSLSRFMFEYGSPASHRMTECWKWRPRVVRIVELGTVQNCGVRFFSLKRTCRKCLSSNTPTLPYSNACELD
jgi:hypothetical protein